MLADKIPYIIFLAVCHILALLVICFFILGQVRRLVRKQTVNRSEKIFSVAVTIIFFKSTLQQAILTPLKILVLNTQKLFYIVYAYTSVKNETDSSEISAIEEKNPLNENIISVHQILDVFPLAALLGAVAFTVLLYFITRYVKQNLSNHTTESMPAQGSKSIFVYNSIVSLILLLSLFLVISVCITIPYLNQISKPSPFTISRLDSTLNNYSRKDSLFFPVVNASPFPDSLSGAIVNDSAKRQLDTMDNPGKQAILNNINSFERLCDSYNNVRQGTINELNTFRTNYKSKENDYKTSLRLNFETQSQSIITDKAELFQASVRSFNEFTSSQQQWYQNTLERVNYSDRFNSEAIRDAIKLLKADLTNFLKKPVADTLYSQYNNLNYATYYLSSYDFFAPRNFSELYVPVFVRTGDEWGFFGWISKYLITTQSPELVLLMGMFGFGLLGASLLSFQKSEGNGNFIESFKTKLLIINFGSVLARGFGAALIIYLATKGGLAIFSAGTNTDANGYILLLFCFVGAVYSDKVWTKIQRSLYPDTNTNADTTDKSLKKNNENPVTSILLKVIHADDNDPTKQEKNKKEEQ